MPLKVILNALTVCMDVSLAMALSMRPYRIGLPGNVGCHFRSVFGGARVTPGYCT